MIGKAFKIMTVSFLAIFAVSHNAMAQEEGGIPIKEETEEIRPDSVPDLEMIEESRTLPVETNDSDFIPLTNQKGSDILIIPAKPLPNSNIQEDKPKIKDPKSESSFNIFYYLIYKFRSKEGSGD